MKSTSQIWHYIKKLDISWDNEALKIALKRTIELLMDIEVSALIDAEHYERNQTRVAYRNGYRQRTWRTDIGKIRLNIPKLRRGTYMPDFLTSETADIISQVLQQTFIFGITPSDIQTMLESLGFAEITRATIAQVHSLFSDLSESAKQFSIKAGYSCLWLDVTDFAVETDYHNQHKQLALAVGIQADGSHDVLGFKVTSNVNYADFWREFLRELTERGLENVRLVVSAAYRGVKSAIYEELPDAEWQYSRAHAVHEVLRYVPNDEHASVTSAISTVFVQSDYQSASTQLDHVIDSLSTSQIQSVQFLDGVRDNLLAYTALPTEEQMILETINTLLRIKQALLGENTTHSGFIDAVSRQTIIGELESDITHRLNLPMPIMTLG